MITDIFVNLAVKDLVATKAFFAKLGFACNAQFTDDNAACLVIGEHMFAMLITEPFFKTFTPRAIADTTKVTEVLTALSVESKEKVDWYAETALTAGGREHRDASDMGFMYVRAIEDLDGHVWEFFWMDPSHVQKA